MEEQVKLGGDSQTVFWYSLNMNVMEEEISPMLFLFVSFV